MWHLRSLLLIGSTLISCSSRTTTVQAIDQEKIKEEVLAIHNASLRAHWERDPYYFIQNLSDDYITVSNAEIKKPTKDEIFSIFSNYLSKTTFLEYRDTHDPIIGYSADGSVAWLIAQVQVTGLRTNETNQMDTIRFKSAHISVFERQNEKWIRKTNVSTSVSLK